MKSPTPAEAKSPTKPLGVEREVTHPVGNFMPNGFAKPWLSVNLR